MHVTKQHCRFEDHQRIFVEHRRMSFPAFHKQNFSVAARNLVVCAPDQNVRLHKMK